MRNIITKESTFTLGQAIKLSRNGLGRTKGMSLLREWGFLDEKNRASDKMVRLGYMVQHSKVLKSGEKRKVSVSLVTMSGIYFLKLKFEENLQEVQYGTDGK